MNMQSFNFLCSLVIAIAATLVTAHADHSAQTCSHGDFMRDTDACNVYYRCVHSRWVRMPSCHTFMGFSMTHMTCVMRGSEYDDCLPLPYSPTQLNETCRQGLINIFANPARCHQFYNCSREPPIGKFAFLFPLYHQECSYPDLFSVEHGRCMRYQDVVCHQRYEAKNPWEYDALACRISHCRPRAVDYSNCTGQPNGLHGQGVSYVLCIDERSSLTMRCDEGTVFSSEEKKCIPNL